MLAYFCRLSGVQIVETGHAISDEFVFIELPNDFPVFIEFKQLRAVWSGVAIVDDDMAVAEFFETRNPLKCNLRVRNRSFDFPNNLLFGGYFDNRIAGPRTNESVAAL